MLKMTVYDVEVVVRMDNRVEKRSLLIGARNKTIALHKARRLLNEGPRGSKPVLWDLTGKAVLFRKVYY